ncbi:MAG: alpha-galactosidase [Clostridia bacterium]|nr:alpha-galactosidase [Clostridia bacterium]
MSKIINQYKFKDMTVSYILNDNNRAVMVILPSSQVADILSNKNNEVYNNSSLVHLLIGSHNAGMLSNSFKFSETLSLLRFKEQYLEECEDSITVVTVEEAEEGFGIRHRLCWYKNENGFEVNTEFYNNSGRELELEYLTSVSLDALSPCLDNEGSKNLVFHRFKAGWCMEGLHLANTLTELGLERAWATSAESLKFGAVGARAVREYHPYCAIEDTENNIIWGTYLAHNASWQMELTRLLDGVSMSIGLADSVTGHWSKTVKNGESFVSPTAMVSVAKGSIAELSNRLLSMRHRAIDAYGEEGMQIIYNEFVTTWGKPTENNMLEMADILSKGKTKYMVVDAGWFKPYMAPGDWIVDRKVFPNGMKSYTDKIRAKGMIPGIWMEFECAEAPAKAFGSEFDDLKLKKNGRVIVGEVINGRRENFFDFRNQKAVEYLEEKVIKFLKDNGFGYIKVDYNTSPGAVVDGEESGGENLRLHMEKVREFFIKMKKEIPDLIIENCASGGCRLEPSMMDITAMSSASDTHEGYEGAIVAANLHYVTPPRQNQIWCTLKPEYSRERFSYIISQGFLGRLCWSGLINELSEEQLQEMFKAEEFYEKVSPVIKHGDSYIYRTDICSFYSPTGTQAVVRYSEDKNQALIVAHGLENAKNLEICLDREYIISESLYNDNIDIRICGNKLTISPKKNFVGDVILLQRI